MDEKVISSAFSAGKKKCYLSDKMVQLINKQIQLEFNAGQLYKAMSTWCEYTGWEGLAKFMKTHVEDERMHMEKLYTYALDRQVNPITPMVSVQPTSFKDLKDILEKYGLVKQKFSKYSCAYHKSQGLDYAPRPMEETVGAAYV